MNARGTNKIRTTVLAVPGLGYVLRLGWHLVRLPKHLDRLANEQHTARTSVDILHQTIADHGQIIEQQTTHSVKFDQQIGELRHRITLIKGTNLVPVADKAPAAFADDHDLDSFYIEFENRFRGTEDEIKERLKVYVPRFKKLGVDFENHPILDIGCGRGELLQVLKDAKINAIGLDLNESMVQRCKNKGLQAVQADALAYLAQQKTGSLGAITGIHIVEHIPFNFLLRLFEECHRVLTPGGIVLFETPNPESLHVGSYAFYYDPSHLNPIVPDVLAFAIENRGFDRAEILRLHPKGDTKTTRGKRDKHMTEVIDRFYAAQDYAVIGYKTKA